MASDKFARKNPHLQPTEDFASVYANNVIVLPTVFDIQMIFGEMDQQVEPLVVRQHTSVTMSWIEAKLLQYFLSLQIAAHETVNGTIKIPAAIVPEPPTAPTQEVLKEEPQAAAIYSKFLEFHKQLTENS
jgi:hypothetical protein